MSHYPHVCPSCGSPAYVGLNSIECSGVVVKCKHGRKEAPAGEVAGDGFSALWNMSVVRRWACFKGHTFRVAGSAHPACPICGTSLCAGLP